MKKILFLLILPLLSYAQSMDTDIKGIIELDGHLFKNDTLKEKYKVKADLYDVVIYKGNYNFTRRKCEIERCKTIHLIKKNEGYILHPNTWGITTSSSMLLNK